MWILDRYIASWDADSLGIVVGRDDSDPFNRSAARNYGIASAPAEILLVADADTVWDRDSIERGVSLVESGEANWVIPYGRHDYYNLTEEFSDKLLQQDPMTELKNLEWDFKIQSWAGLLIIRKSDWEKVGGYDERFKGWGWEDVAFRLKMEAEIGPFTRVPGRAMHIWHERAGDDFGSDAELANRRLFDQEYRRKYKWVDERLR